jgi:predicted O-methyltransferase YrrM
VRLHRRLETESRIRRAAQDVSNAPRLLDGALDYAFGVRPASVSIAPNQVRSELRDFLLLVRALEPRAVLEIGTALGGTLFLLTRVSAPDAVLVSVDLASPQDLRFGGGRVAQRRPLYGAFALEGQRVHFLVGDSHTAEMRDRIERTLDGRKLDLLFIDGDHTEAGVQGDFELYRGLVRPGGLIAFHDIADGPPDLVGGVPQVWRSVSPPDAYEYVADPAQGGFGIGAFRR